MGVVAVGAALVSLPVVHPVLQVVAEEGEEEEAAAVAQTEAWSYERVEVAEEEEEEGGAEEGGALALGHWVAFVFPADLPRSVWPYPLWPAARPLPDNRRRLWRTPASG